MRNDNPVSSHSQEIAGNDGCSALCDALVDMFLDIVASFFFRVDTGVSFNLYLQSIVVP